MKTMAILMIVMTCDEDEEEERDPNFLVPTYINQPDPDDLCALKWGKDHYMRYLPSMKRKPYT